MKTQPEICASTKVNAGEQGPCLSDLSCSNTSANSKRKFKWRKGGNESRREKKEEWKKRRKGIVYRKKKIYSAVLHVLFQKSRVIKNENYRDWVHAPLVTCTHFRKQLNLSKPRFPHPWNGGNSNLPVALLSGLTCKYIWSGYNCAWHVLSTL